MTPLKKIQKVISPAEILSNNLNHFAHTKNIHEAELARQTNIPQPTLHKILTGKTTDPRISTVQTLADYFGVTLDALYSETAFIDNRGALKGKSIPVISWSDCIYYRTVLKKLTPTNWGHWVLIKHDHQQSCFALKSKVATEPHFPKGTLFIIDTQTTPKDGDFVVVHFDNTPECTLRELSIDGRTEILLPLNTRAKAEKHGKSIHIIGIVLESRFLYEER
ncbi:MAG: hypothetical protein ACD_42C00114G0006 [uncultured bacterium]|nr:MAG: hypothetical protein ACD_42C00114G0006 [uncultured bacterium]OGT32519.1 MAG: hypothetical protein A3C44_02090 [Gammaproteobacteria bacterium RIFCSPHIGHO2_02_FULL_39_13]OGT48327.1 MAG: hypothetical protein A3E53_05785 [Gammaproteobacteria bacterium RIFCSPHIGHO2_12_FULL_39_24]